jgi:hypothetical protein
MTLADHQPVEQHTQRRQVLLDRGCGEGFRLVILVLEVLEEGGDVEGPHVGKLEAVRVAPGREAFRGVQISNARVVILDLGREEITRALGGLGRRHVEPCGKHGGGRGGEELVCACHLEERLLRFVSNRIRFMVRRSTASAPQEIAGR